jgi:hypothetical protein
MTEEEEAFEQRLRILLLRLRRRPPRWMFSRKGRLEPRKTPVEQPKPEFDRVYLRRGKKIKEVLFLDEKSKGGKNKGQTQE